MMTHDPVQRNTARNRACRCVMLAAALLLGACITDTPEDFDSPAAGMTRIAGQIQAKGDLGGAADFYQRALQRDPKNLTAMKGLAAIYDQTGNISAAADMYREALAIKPGDGETQRNYGRALIALDRPAEAKQAFESAIDADSDDAKAHNGLGIALDYLGDHKAAQKEFAEALELDEGNLSTLNNYAYSLIQTRDYDRAIKLLEPQQNNPKATAALRGNLALAYGLSGMELDAERVAKRDLSPEKVKANLAYYKTQRAEMAVTTTPYAEVGTYATEAMAAAEIERLKGHLARTRSGLKPVIAPEIAAPGGTPRFTVRMLGCTKKDEVKKFCDDLAAMGLPCMARGGKE